MGLFCLEDCTKYLLHMKSPVKDIGAGEQPLLIHQSNLLKSRHPASAPWTQQTVTT